MGEVSFSEIGAVVSIVVSLGAAIGTWAVNNYKTNQNTKKQEALEKKFDAKCINLVDWKGARETFVSKEAHEGHKDHIDETLRDIKDQNSTILNLLITQGNKDA